ncbi:hypothetical protein ACL598_06925 [Bordetella bronchialis]|uniref:hypothetical protein n=1 Tax=Bordetella bronchialis TaxID=463025 RepID=UPI003D0407D0
MSLPFIEPQQLFNALSPAMHRIANEVMRDEALTPRRANDGRLKGGLVSMHNTASKRAITRDIVRGASELLARDACTMNACARSYGISQQALRSFVEPDGHLTALGRAVDDATLITPQDRKAANLPPTAGRTVLDEKDYALADKLVGMRAGQMSRALFCEMFGYDHETVYRAYEETGAMTAFGRQTRHSLRGADALEGSSEADAGQVAADAAAPDVERALAEQRLTDLATRAKIRIRYWRNDTFQTFGAPEAPLAGDVDRAGGHWRIRPSRLDEYRMAPRQWAMDHIVDILRLHARGASGRAALAARYALTPSGIGRALLVAPKPGTHPEILSEEAIDTH